MQLNEDTMFILGRPNFWCNPIAIKLREMGHKIPFKSEDEQAHVINLMLEFYETHGTNWRSELESHLKRAIPIVQPITTESRETSYVK